MFPTLLAVALVASPELPPLQLEPLLEEVGRSAPQVATGQADVAVARARVKMEGAWEDPQISVMVEDLAVEAPHHGSEPLEPMLSYRLMQPLNVFGRRSLAKQAARAQQAQAQAGRRRAEWDARGEAVRTFYELWMTDEMDALLGRQISTLERMRGAALSQYAAGLRMGHHDVLRAEAEIALMEAERSALVNERVALGAMLNGLRGHPQEQPVGRPVLPPQVPLESLEQLLALKSRTPELEGMRAMRKEMEARRELARKMYLPMPMAGLFYQQRPGPMQDSVGAELAFTVPLFWFDRQKNEVAMSEAMVQKTQRQLEAMEVMTETGLRMAWSRARAAELALSALEKTVIGRLRETVLSAESAYVSGSDGFLSLLDATMALQRAEAERLQAATRLGMAHYELERLVAAPVGEE